MKKPTVCLVGRPNTGKSTLFNKLTEKKTSIIDDLPGVTRDRIYGSVTYKDKSFHLIDTGGIDIENEDFNLEVKTQAEIAINESDIIVFVCDGKDGLTTNDIAIRDILRKTKKNVILVINKIDNSAYKNNKYDFYSLGFEDFIEISAEHKTNLKTLLDKIVKDFDILDMEEEEECLKFSVIGRPNVGKSSLVNALLNEERVIVSDVPGTTRDSIDTKFVYNDNEYILIDTAGMRKRGRIFESIERYSLIRTLKSIDRSDVCLLLLDAQEGIVEQDKHIASYALEAGKAIVIVVNKWDTVLNKETDMKKWIKEIKNNFQFMPWAEVVFLSALTKKRIHTLIPSVLKSYENATKEVKSSLITDIVLNAYIETPPPTYKRKRLKIYFVHPSGLKPPRFDIEVNSKGLVHFSYERYLENKIRENIDFSGTPIVLNFKSKGEK